MRRHPRSPYPAHVVNKCFRLSVLPRHCRVSITLVAAGARPRAGAAAQRAQRGGGPPAPCTGRARHRLAGAAVAYPERARKHDAGALLLLLANAYIVKLQ